MRWTGSSKVALLMRLAYRPWIANAPARAHTSTRLRRESPIGCAGAVTVALGEGVGAERVRGCIRLACGWLRSEATDLHLSEWACQAGGGELGAASEDAHLSLIRPVTVTFFHDPDQGSSMPSTNRPSRPQPRGAFCGHRAASARLLEQLGPAGLERALSRGRSMTADEGVKFALEA